MCDGKYDSPRIDYAAVELNDLICHWLSFPPEEFAAGWETAAVACGAVLQDDMIFRRTNWPPDEFAAGRNGDYIWRDLWTGPSVCNQPVTGSLAFGSSQRLGRCCLWLAALPSHWIGSTEVPLRLHLLLAVSSREPHKVALLSQLTGMHLWIGASIIWSYPWIFHCVCTLYGQMAEVYLLNYTCICMIRVSVCFFSFLLLIQQFTRLCQLPPYFRLILTFSYCIHKFLREQELETDRMPVTDMTDPFYDNVFAPDRRDVRELWAIRPRANFVMVIYVCELHVFFHQYVADIRDKRSENVVLLMSALRDSQPEVENYVLQSACQFGKPENIFRTISTSPLVFDVTVMSSSGVKVSASDVPVGQIQPLTAVVSSADVHYGHSVRCSSASRY